MSRKLIAVASAAALALSVLVGVAPASATTTVSGGGSNSGLTAALAKEVDVPSLNSVETGVDDIVTFTVSSAADRTVSATSTGGIKLLTATSDADGDKFKSTDGATTVGISTGVSTSVTFYAFTTSTATGTVVVNDGVGNTQTFYMKGTAGPAYNIDVTVPSSVATTGTGSAMQIAVTDVFGNALADLGPAGLEISTLGSGSSVHETDSDGTEIDAVFTATANYNTTKKVFEVNLRSTTGGGVAVTVALRAASATPGAPADVTGLAKPRAAFFAAINATDLAAQATALTAQVAALQAQVDNMRTKARSVTKKRWNNLVKRHRALGGSAKLKTR